MRLSDLLGHNGRAGEVEIAGLTADSRNVAPGYLFAALSGARADGRDFIADAVKKGAVAVLAPPGSEVAEDTVYLLPDDNPRRRFAYLAARFFNAQPETTVAVTGTNGKSSVAAFTRQIWQALRYHAASLGTLGLVAPGTKFEPGLTTPDPESLHRTLKDLAESGVTHLALEASSHGLSQYRLDGVRLKAAAFTNLTHEHLDYHGSEDAYFHAKLRLFGELLPPGSTAVLNADSDRFDDIEHVCWARGVHVISVGRAGETLRLANVAPKGDGQILTVAAEGKEYELDFPLAGDFQAMNALIAAGLAVATGAPVPRALKALEGLEGVPGRLSLVDRTPENAAVYVDYAHTPDALETVLTALRPHASGRLIVIFGCGGERDTAKRPLMGEIATRLADTVIVTDDNPRHEDAAAIRAEVLAAAPGARDIGDRGAAIRQAVSELRSGDVLVIAGKGHEKGQIVGDTTLPFDDTAEARRAIRAKGGEE